MVGFCLVGVARAQSPECRLFLLKKTKTDFVLEAVSLKENEVQVFSIGKSSDVLTAILPYAPGRSGDFIQGDESRFLVVHYVDGELRPRVRKSDGSERALPPLKAADLVRYDIRINITGKNAKKALLLSAGGRVEPADGPVLDMFGGQIPLGDNDYAITLEIAERQARASRAGEAPLEFVRARSGDGGYLFVKAAIPGGVEADFLVDFGASRTVVARAILPKDVAIREAMSTEYSERGARSVAYAASGAGGTVDRLFVAELTQLRVGTLVFQEPGVLVLDDLPVLASNRRIGGILGLDLLQQSNSVAFAYGPDGEAKLVCGAGSAGGATVDVPFSIVAEHIVVKARVGDAPVDLILDTGSPESFVNPTVAHAAGLDSAASASKPVTGLDGASIDVHTAVGRLFLGSKTYERVPMSIADLPLLHTLGLHDTAGLLGGSFLRRFKRIEADFVAHTLRFTE